MSVAATELHEGVTALRPHFALERRSQASGDPTVTTLSPHGSLESNADGKKEFGTWQFTPWDATPAKTSRPSSAPNSCVLWLHWIADSGNLDLVYLPLEVTDTSIQLSYVGRGNTIDWQRTTAQ